MATISDTPAPWLSSQRIMIAGAGPSSLSLALSLLHLHSLHHPHHPPPSMTIFERDSYSSRVGREGYTLSLRSDSRSGGIQALDRLGLYEKCLSASVGGEEGTMHFWNRTFSNDLMAVRIRPVKGVNTPSLRSMRIRRNALQKILADACIAEGVTIHWGTAVTDAHYQKDGDSWIVNVSGGRSYSCDLLIAADGAKSRLRANLRPEMKLECAGVTALTGMAVFDKPSDMPEAVMRDWGLILGGEGVSGFVSPVTERSALWSLSYRNVTPREAVKQPVDSEVFNTLLTEAHGLAGGFDGGVHTLIDHTEPSTLQILNANNLAPFPNLPHLRSSGPVVFVGDASHAVSPFAGNGANMALMDGWDLAQALCTNETWREGVKAYDAKFMPRCLQTRRFEWWSIEVAHARGWRAWLYMKLIQLVRWVFVNPTDVE